MCTLKPLSLPLSIFFARPEAKVNLDVMDDDKILL
jgi:hypothetical protein